MGSLGHRSILWSTETRCRTVLLEGTRGKFVSLQFCRGSSTHTQLVRLLSAQTTPHSQKTDLTPSIPKQPQGGSREAKARCRWAWAETRITRQNMKCGRKLRFAKG